ncbi:alpha/beta hydrolase [Fructilactobacillus myrtifloralis]|uniref:Alpha/beta hydrolase n=1 Tax=Fructilactobacillus myrtifloralis TaxID=2940301 RepID=A0ABY5BLW7_9LACO|nr:alpha/beta hydrolase [Fructilactobacillus myrtifloralis]USS84617.1 alpha/beta hydrolase [Fructilactobacillus myrtifloralis]
MITTKDISFKARDLNDIELQGRLFFPENFDESQKHPAIVVNHPTTSDFNQTSGRIYATKLAKQGWLAIAYDSPYQGRSAGEPHNSEIPYARTIGVMAAIDYLDTLPYVDSDRIGAMGICGGGGFTLNAAKFDKRIKAVAGVCPADVGTIYRETFGQNDKTLIENLEDMAKQRTAEAQGAEVKYIPALPASQEARKEAGINDIDIEQAIDYYLTPRGHDDYAPNRYVYSVIPMMLNFDPLSLADKLATQPLEIIVGGVPGAFGSYRFGYQYYDAAATNDKELVVLPGVSHYDLYDQPEPTDKAVAKLNDFFGKRL